MALKINLIGGAGKRKSSYHSLVQRIWGHHSVPRNRIFQKNRIVVRKFLLSCSSRMRLINKNSPHHFDNMALKINLIGGMRLINKNSPHQFGNMALKINLIGGMLLLDDRVFEG
jgi:hypothetical protein